MYHNFSNFLMYLERNRFLYRSLDLLRYNIFVKTNIYLNPYNAHTVVQINNKDYSISTYVFLLLIKKFPEAIDI